MTDIAIVLVKNVLDFWDDFSDIPRSVGGSTMGLLRLMA